MTACLTITRADALISSPSWLLRLASISALLILQRRDVSV